MSSLNLAARAGWRTAVHWKNAVALLVAFIDVAIGVGTAIGTHKPALLDSRQERHRHSPPRDDEDFKLRGNRCRGRASRLRGGLFLRRQGRRFVTLERASRIAPAWRERWDSLTLFTPRRYSALPGLPFPGDPDGYPTRDEVIAYLERYAETLELPIELNTIELNSEVKRLGRGEDGRFHLEADGQTITADQVVVATGPFQSPYVPKLAERLASGVFQTHAVGYHRADQVPAGTVLVVGGGNTGFQIAKELSASHKVVLSVGSRQKPLPQRLLGRDVFWWLTKARILDKTLSRVWGAAELPGHADRVQSAHARETLRR